MRRVDANKIFQPAALGWNSITTAYIPTPNLGDAFAPRKAGKKKSHIVFILDDSGSMQSCRDGTIDGFNEYLSNQKNDAEQTGIKTFVSLYKFDGTNVNCVFSRKRIDKVKPLNYDTYNPMGMTNLYDGMGGVMMKINDMLADKPKDQIIINVLTDGYENSSRTFNAESIRTMVSKAEDANWGFMFMGANIDAFAAGSAIGFAHHNTMQFTTENVGATMRAASRKSSDMKMAYSMGNTTLDTYSTTAFTDAERSSAIGDGDE